MVGGTEGKAVGPKLQVHLWGSVVLPRFCWERVEEGKEQGNEGEEGTRF